MNAPVVGSANNNDSGVANTDEIPSLLVPMANAKLVLPTVSVAEMIPYQAPQARQTVVCDTIPDWYLGNLNWRGVSVPMLSYEQLNGEPVAEILSHSQILILNNTGVDAQLPFLCMPTQGIPRLSRIAVNEISENVDAFIKEYDQMHVYVAGEQGIIPDISKLERACASMLGFA
ncbi:MAG: chemosensory pili system protein ChpC [Cellvibrionaceae bacterium]|jgi:chemosensory pili system protein ChpC